MYKDLLYNFTTNLPIQQILEIFRIDSNLETNLDSNMLTKSKNLNEDIQMRDFDILSTFPQTQDENVNFNLDYDMNDAELDLLR